MQVQVGFKVLEVGFGYKLGPSLGSGFGPRRQRKGQDIDGFQRSMHWGGQQVSELSNRIQNYLLGESPAIHAVATAHTKFPSNASANALLGAARETPGAAGCYRRNPRLAPGFVPD